MGINANKVFVGLPEQSTTTGALSYGAVLTTIPKTFDEAVSAISGFQSSGYISEDGATLTYDRSTTDIIEWAKAKVRRVLDSADATIETTLIQLDAIGAKQAFGDDNVTVTAANAQHGEQMHIAIGAHVDEPRAWALRVKDGDMRLIALVPSGQVTSGVEITFAATDPISLPITISGNDDGNGDYIHIFVDDGVKAA
jgi:hypothetical protein